MNNELILKSSMLDILFEHRNKAYGAYNLRLFYNNRLFKSIMIILVSVTILSALAFYPIKHIKIEMPDEILSTGCFILPEKKEIIKQKKPLNNIEIKKNNTIKFIKNIVIKKYPVDEIYNLNKNENIGSKNFINLTNNNNIDGEIIKNVGEIKEGIKIDSNKNKLKEVDILTPLEDAEIMPTFPGGMAALKLFLEKNLINPKEMENEEEVNVKIRYVVGYDGKLKRFEIEKDGGEEFNNEVIRVLKKMPNWIPGKNKDGNAVSVYYTIPVKFVSYN